VERGCGLLPLHIYGEGRGEELVEKVLKADEELVERVGVRYLYQKTLI